MKQLYIFMSGILFSITSFCMDTSVEYTRLQNNSGLQRYGSLKNSPALDRVKKQLSGEIRSGQFNIDGKIIPRRKTPQKQEKK